MHCTICHQEIQDYNPAFHHMPIDKEHGVDICPSCIDAFFKWQGKIASTLFPTKAMKKRFSK